MKASDHLKLGEVYTHYDFGEMDDIAAGSVLFRPGGHDSIVIFVTQDGTGERISCKGSLRGDHLQFDGQKGGITDQWLMEHERRGLEVLLLYRGSQDVYAGDGFRYHGAFKYVGHRGQRPTQFQFRRLPDPKQ